jgi:hypothetical protein
VNAIRAAFVSFVVLGLACSKGGPATTVDAGALGLASAAAVEAARLDIDTTLESTGAPATMNVLDPGKMPRRKLRYTWYLAQNESLTMDLRTSASTEEGNARQPEIQLPPVHIVVAIEPRRVSSEGDLEYSWRVASSSVSGAPQAPSSVTEGMQSEVAAIERLSGAAVVTSRGLAKSVSIDPSSLGDASRRGQMIEQVRQTLRDIAAPFPEQEVGRGARWEKLSQLASRDARVTQVETFTLLDLGADVGSLDDILAQTAPPQPLLGPAGANGGARIESMLASGDGKTRFELSRLVPQTTFDGTTTMVVSGQSSADDARRMTMIMRMGIVLSGAVQ